MVKNKVLNKFLKHYINLEYYANGIDEEFQTLLEDLQKRCDAVIKEKEYLNTKLQYSLIMKYIKEQVEEFRKELEERLEEEAETIMNEEEKFLEALYPAPEVIENQKDKDEEDDDDDDDDDSKKKDKLSKTALTLGGISLTKLLFAPIDGKDTTKQFVDRTAKNLTQTYDAAVRAGYLFGQKAKDVVNQVDKGVKQVSRGMQSGIRTAIPSYAKTTDRIVFLNNNEEVVYCAILDGRTCLVCGSNHGLHFKSISTAPSVPQHANCRCFYLRASDVTDSMPTYEEYLEGLSEDEQYHILGKNRYNLWKEYNTPLERFINNGTVIPLSELQKEIEK